MDASVRFSPDKRLYLKAALVQFIQSCIGIFSEATGTDYDHWLDDPVLLRVFQDVFAPELQVLGVLCSLRPWKRKVPDPYLSSSCAPIRQLIRGSLKAWHVQAPEDMRLMSHSQLHAPVDEADWHVHVFGYEPSDSAVDRADAPRSLPPASMLPAPVEKKNGGKISSSPSTTPAPSSSPSTTPAPSSSARPSSPPAALQPEDDIRPWNEDGAMEEEPEQAEEEEFKAVRPDEEEKVLKPLFDFRKVYKRLQSDIVTKDPQMAKRLLLGLHERFYHCPIGDFKNMLLRAGLSSDILPLAEEAVMSCSICRKYVRMPNRPQVKIGANAGAFNQRVQLDLFQYQEVWILLMVDEATRFKVATDVENREYNHLLTKMLDVWFTVFGPPHQLVLDQESSLMSHAAGRELERFSVERVPKGTTSGAAGKQHTGTGLVERRIGLVEITMLKLSAELDRQGLRLSPGELAKESAMSHNQTLNYNGASPSMAVFGILPRPFYQEDGDNITAVAGALQTDITPFEKALRIRQLSLSMVQRAVAEDRIARAGRTRPHKLDIGTLIPGTTAIDFYREVQGDVGWRGPATLLRLDKDEGTAILTYQGRPYLVSLRHIRAHTPGVFLVLDNQQSNDFQWLQGMAMKLSPFKAVTVGWVPEYSNHCLSWRRASTSSLSYSEAWSKIVSLGKALSNQNVGGAMLGQGVRVLHPPKGSSGVLLFWRQGQEGYGSQEHNDDSPLAMKRVATQHLDQLAFIYVFYYVNVSYEPTAKLKVVPSEGAVEQPAPMDVDEPPNPTTRSTSPSVSMDVDGSADPRPSTVSGEKRKGPESRMITIGPEAKKSKLENLVEYLFSERVICRTQHNLINLYWLMHRTQRVPLESPLSWQAHDNHYAMAQWDIYMSRVFTDVKKKYVTHNHLFVWPGKHQETVFADLLYGETYKVDSEADNIAEGEIYDIWPLVEKSDASEIKQFVDTGSFRKMHINSLTEDFVLIDSVWIRKWKRMPDGSKNVKSRLCARGCFDSQKDLLSTRSTTATRLSQRLLLSTAANMAWDIESWDVSGAFLKGLSFERVREILQSKGIATPIRRVAVVAPANVWRHLGNFSAAFRVDLEKVHEYVLYCLKPIYGLNDAPLAWQLCLHGLFEEQGGRASLLDENLFYWKDGSKVKAIVTTHVDDCGAGAKTEWLAKQHQLLVQKFGKVTRQQLPFVHCGVQYSKTSEGFLMTQDDFCKKLKPVTVPPHRKDLDDLTPEEVTSFRSILGGLLWLTATRLDIVADVCLLQTHVTRAKVSHLRQANNIVKRAQSVEPNLGLRFRQLRGPLRVMCVHDSSAAGTSRQYAQEGILVLLAEDHLRDLTEYEHILTNGQTHLLGGKVHVLWAHGAKAKRVSYSTSHAETLAAISGLEAASLMTVRLAELLYVPKPSIHALLAVQERGVRELPVDDLGDCRDLFELVSGERGISQDKGQRLYVLALREARMSQRLRWVGLVPTASMTADALTKSMLAPPMMQLLSSGTVSFHNEEKHAITLRTLPLVDQVEERHFDLTDKELIREVSTLATSMWCASRSLSSTRTSCFFALAAAALSSSTAAATTTTTPTSSATSSSASTAILEESDDNRSLITFIALVLSAEWLLWGFARHCGADCVIGEFKMLLWRWIVLLRIPHRWRWTWQTWTMASTSMMVLSPHRQTLEPMLHFRLLSLHTMLSQFVMWMTKHCWSTTGPWSTSRISRANSSS